MERRQRELLSHLQRQSQPVTAKELAGIFGISERTVKRDIKMINSLYDDCIDASVNGYIYNHDHSAKLSVIDNTPQTNEERARSIIKKLLLENRTLPVQYFLDEFYISESTFKSSVLIAKKTIERYDLRIQIKHQFVEISGNEADKRTLIRDYVYEETTTGFIDLNDIEAFFPTINTRAVVRAIQSSFNKHQTFIDEYTLYSLSLHLIIRRDRAHLDHKLLNATTDDQMSFDISNDIFEQLHETIRSPYNEADVLEFASLISNQLRRNHDSNIEDDLKSMITLTETILHEIEETYEVAIDDPNFISKFALHLTNLKIRVDTQSQLKNPMLQSLRTNFPFTYDIAVFVSQRIQHYLDMSISDHEIAYIALHVGSYFEAQQAYAHRTKTALVCPDFYQFNVTLAKKIQDYFGQSLLLVDVVNDVESLPNKTYDLVLSTIPVSFLDQPSLMISSFFTDQDHMDIQNYIDSLQRDKKRKRVRELLSTLTSPKSFMVDHLLTTPADAIHALCNTLEHHEYISVGFEEDTLLRENLSPTKYGVLAIPHPVRLQANTSQIGIIVSQQGIPWHDGIVHLVLLMAIHKSQIHEFQELLNIIILNHERIQNNIKSLMVDHHDIFIERLINLLEI